MAKTLRVACLAALVLAGCAASSSGAGVAPCVSYGGPVAPSEVTLAELLEPGALERAAARRQELRVAGVLTHGRTPLRYLCVSPRHPRPLSSPECLLLSFEWKALGVHEDEAARIFAQWTGRRVSISGFIAPGSVPVGPGHLCVQAIGLIDRTEPSPPSYCPDYTGPLQPSADEVRDRESGVSASCRGEWISFDTGGARACIERYEPVIWLRRKPLGFHAKLLPQPGDERLAFDVPAPYAGRDIWEFAPLAETVHLFTLVDGRLFALAQGVVTEIDGPRVDQLRRTPESDVVYYRLRTPTAGGGAVVSEIRAIDESLTPRTIWRSDSERINLIRARSGWPLTLFVEGGLGDRTLTRGENGDWIESPPD